jgi:hypothetical protein
MGSKAVFFAGARITSGRKPVTFAALNDRLEIVLLKQWEFPEVLQCLLEYEHVQLAIHSSNTITGRDLFQSFQERIAEIGFKHSSTKEGSHFWIESNADECYRAFQPNLFPRQSLEGRLQRGLILYDEGLQIPDPMEFFEEITRHKLLQGVLPSEYIHSARQLDALMMAYISWMAGNPAVKLINRDNLTLPAPE